jgi:hypothetical protein
MGRECGDAVAADRHDGNLLVFQAEVGHGKSVVSAQDEPRDCLVW